MSYTKTLALVLLSHLVGISLFAGETFTPYRTAGEVPRNVVDLWKDYDARAEALDVRVVREWKTPGAITRYVTFRIGTFRGAEARLAAYYSFPDNGRKNSAFVWSHGGGQRAERNRGVYFAQQGFATVDINWLGRPLEEGIEINTDWGNVDPTQGPGFYARALRKGWKRNLQPDEHSIDPVTSPRNANWFLLVVAARRAITFLERQPEVDPDRIGFTGYSMGGMITALVAIDPRLKAVAPFVGGSGFKHVDFPGGIEGSSIRTHFRDLELYKSTIDASAYWPLVTCPVAFITSSNDFHSTFERIYDSMALLDHSNWRVSCNVHQNHGPGPEQWAVLNLWFDRHLRGLDRHIPITPPSTLRVAGNNARFTVTPADQDRLVATEVYYSHDPNSRTRFWNRAEARLEGGSWQVDLRVHDKLPLYVFALCRYRLPQELSLERGKTSTFTLNSIERSIVPQSIDLAALSKLVEADEAFEDFKNGVRDWSSRDQRTLRTYKFQSPRLDRSPDRQLALTIDPLGKSLILRLNAESKFLSRKDNLGSFSCVKHIEGHGERVVRISRDEFRGPEGRKLEWSKIASFDVSIIDRATRAKLPLATAAGREVLKRIALVDEAESTRAAPQITRPNIIFLFADDQRADTIGAHGNPHVRTPHLDKLVDAGFSFRRNYCAGSFSGAVCVASRAMLMTGRHWLNLPKNRPQSNWGDATPLPALLATRGGYRSFIVGKWHNGKKTLDSSFTNGRSVYMGGMANHADFRVQDLTNGELSEKRHAGGFSSTVFADEAIRFIDSAETDDPFFLYVAFMAPHDPRNPPERYRQLYYDNRPPLPANYLPEHPFQNAPQATSGRDEGLAPWPRTKEVISDQLCEYYGLITHLDEQVGRVLDALEKSPHAQDTIVIYTADHGLAMGSHGLLGKQNVYEQSMRSPLILRGPGIARGRSSEAYSHIHDLYATVCDFAGVTPPGRIDSRSLRPIIDGKLPSVRESMFLPFQDNQRAVSDGRWKLHVYPKINHRLLFDLDADPHETKDLSADPKHQATLAKMLTLMESQRSRLADPYPLEVDNPAPKEAIYDNRKRVLDVWQPEWIREKYFGGRSNPNHGRRAPKKKPSVPVPPRSRSAAKPERRK